MLLPSEEPWLRVMHCLGTSLASKARASSLPVWAPRPSARWRLPLEKTNLAPLSPETTIRPSDPIDQEMLILTPPLSRFKMLYPRQKKGILVEAAGQHTLCLARESVAQTRAREVPQRHGPLNTRYIAPVASPQPPRASMAFHGRFPNPLLQLRRGRTRM